MRLPLVCLPLVCLPMLLAACTAEEQPSDPPAAEISPAAQDTAKLAPVATLAGEWRVAGIDGEALDEAYGIALSADEGEIWWEPRCAGIVVSYRIEGYRFLPSDPPPAAPSPVSPDAVPVPPPPVCAVGRPPRLHEVARALNAGGTIGRTPENGVHISGAGHSVTLFSQ